MEAYAAPQALPSREFPALPAAAEAELAVAAHLLAVLMPGAVVVGGSLPLVPGAVVAVMLPAAAAVVTNKLENKRDGAFGSVPFVSAPHSG